MTEAEWLDSTDPLMMLKWAKSRFRHRKLRLFAVACARRIQPLLSDPRSHRAVDVAERFAGGEATDVELRHAEREAAAAHKEAFLHWGRGGKRGACLEWAAQYTCASFAFKAAEAVGWMSATGRVEGETTPAHPALQAALVRDIMGNPFRRVERDSMWLAQPVVALARAIYDERDFGRMPELADALGQAGCSDADVLNHCRDPGPHVRGCWVVDLVLGKA